MMTSAKEKKLLTLKKNKNSYWPDSPVYPKNPENFSPDLSEKQENDAIFLERNSSTENDANDPPERGDDIVVTEISQKDSNKNLSPRGRKYNFRPNPNANFSEDFRY